MTYYIREAIVEHLDDLEDVYLAEQVLERVRRGEESVSSLEDVETVSYTHLTLPTKRIV